MRSLFNPDRIFPGRWRRWRYGTDRRPQRASASCPYAVLAPGHRAGSGEDRAAALGGHISRLHRAPEEGSCGRGGGRHRQTPIPATPGIGQKARAAKEAARSQSHPAIVGQPEQLTAFDHRSHCLHDQQRCRTNITDAESTAKNLRLFPQPNRCHPSNRFLILPDNRGGTSCTHCKPTPTKSSNDCKHSNGRKLPKHELNSYSKSVFTIQVGGLIPQF